MDSPVLADVVTDTFGADVAADVGTEFAGNGMFAPQLSYPVGVNPCGVAIADLDGDGWPDVVTANEVDSTITVLLNSGSGALLTKTAYPTGRLPCALAIADLDGDGKADIVVPSGNDGTVAVFKNRGNGEFGSPTTYTTAPFPLQNQTYLDGVVVVDLDNDMKPDIVVSSDASRSLRIMLNTGSGFQDPAVVDTGQPLGIAASDLDGDGNVDIVIADAGSPPAIVGLGVLLNQGSGTLRAETIYATSSPPSSVTVADLDGDGRPDLVATVSDTTSVSMNVGSGAFGSAMTYATRHAYAVAARDLNGDQRVDIVLANTSDQTVSVRLNDGGLFDGSASYPTGAYPYALAIGDLNRDGALDIVTVNTDDNTISVLLGLH